MHKSNAKLVSEIGRVNKPFMLDILWQKSTELWQSAKYLKHKESLKHFLLKYELNARELNTLKMLVQRSQSSFYHKRFRQTNANVNTA
jgi:hypothetical protein